VIVVLFHIFHNKYSKSFIFLFIVFQNIYKFEKNKNNKL